MIEFAKAFGRGLGYVLLSPLLLVLFAGYMLYALLCYLVLELVSFALFFYGKNFKLEDAQTQKLRQKKTELATRKQAAQSFPPPPYYYNYPPYGVPPQGEMPLPTASLPSKEVPPHE